MNAMIDFELLWKHVAAQFHSAFSIHGPKHWRQVERNGLVLAKQTGADETVVRLFALFHDSRRVNDGWDQGHGERGAALAASLRGELFELDNDRFELLHYACVWHTDQDHHDDATIGTCWDADRLDLGRVGAVPDAAFMSTAFAREITRYGSVERYLAARAAQ